MYALRFSVFEYTRMYSFRVVFCASSIVLIRKRAEALSGTAARLYPTPTPGGQARRISLGQRAVFIYGVGIPRHCVAAHTDRAERVAPVKLDVSGSVQSTRPRS